MKMDDLGGSPYFLETPNQLKWSVSSINSSFFFILRI